MDMMWHMNVLGWPAPAGLADRLHLLRGHLISLGFPSESAESPKAECQNGKHGRGRYYLLLLVVDQILPCD